MARPTTPTEAVLRKQIDRLTKRIDELLAELSEMTKARDELKSRIQHNAGPHHRMVDREW